MQTKLRTDLAEIVAALDYFDRSHTAIINMITAASEEISHRTHVLSEAIFLSEDEDTKECLQFEFDVATEDLAAINVAFERFCRIDVSALAEAKCHAEQAADPAMSIRDWKVALAVQAELDATRPQDTTPLPF